MFIVGTVPCCVAKCWVVQCTGVLQMAEGSVVTH